MFQDYYGDQATEAIAKEFGPQFAVAIEKLKPGSWQGPIQSGYGWHLVFVGTVIPGRVPAFEEMEPDVKTAWLGEQKRQAWQKAYQEMRAKYNVLLPGPSDTEAAQAPVLPQALPPEETSSILFWRGAAVTSFRVRFAWLICVFAACRFGCVGPRGAPRLSRDQRDCARTVQRALAHPSACRDAASDNAQAS